MRFGVLAAALGAIPNVLSDMTFINPPSDTSGQGALSRNAVYAQQTGLTVQWTGGSEGTTSTVALWQVNLTALDEVDPTMGDLEYITNGVAWNITYFPWTVSTRKDLKVSNMFMISLYKTGSTRPDDWSVFFNISSSSASDSTSSTSSTLSATSTSTTESTPSTTDASVSTSPSSSSKESSQGGLDTAAKIGIGVGIPVAVALGIAAGWLIFRKRKNEASHGSAPEPYAREEYKSPAALPMPVYEAEGRERSSTGPHEMYTPQQLPNNR